MLVNFLEMQVSSLLLLDDLVLQEEVLKKMDLAEPRREDDTW